MVKEFLTLASTAVVANNIISPKETGRKMMSPQENKNKVINSPVVINPAMKKELDKLKEENAKLLERVEKYMKEITDLKSQNKKGPATAVDVICIDKSRNQEVMKN